MVKIILTGGGTGGHVYPALALARYLRKEMPDVELLYVGTSNGMEAELVPREGIDFRTVEVTGLSRKISLSMVKTVWKFAKGIVQARSIVKRFQPDVIIGTGGYVCGPVILTGHLMGKKTIIHEQNAIPGLTNRFLSRFADVVAVSFPGTTNHFSRAKSIVVTGNPRAGEVMNAEPERIDKLRNELGVIPDKKCVVVFSGSRGARPINEAVISILSKVVEQNSFQLVYVTGQIHYESVMKQVEEIGREASHQVIIRPFIYDMPALWRIMDVIVCRAGATTLAEMTSSGTPGVLIPSPYVTDNHQEHNARWLVDNGAAVMLLEKDLSGETLYKTITEMISVEGRLDSMRKKSSDLGLTNALEEFTMLLRRLIGSKP